MKLNFRRKKTTNQKNDRNYSIHSRVDILLYTTLPIFREKKMIIPEGHRFGEMRGKISCTPEEALKEYNFIMSPTAQGILFRGYTYLDALGHKHKGTFISNWNPPANPQTGPQQAWRDKMHDAVLDWQFLVTHNPGAVQAFNKRARKIHMSGFNLHNKEYLNAHH